MTAQLHDATDLVARRVVDEADSGGMPSVTKALRLLDVFRSDGPVLGVSELARQAGVAKSTAFRLLALLQEAELVERDGRGYRLSWRLYELGTSVQGSWAGSLREVAAPWLTEVFVRAGGGVVNLAVLDGAEILFLDKVSSPRSPRLAIGVGSRIPATCAAPGKAILAFSPGQVVRAVVEEGMPRRTRYSITESGRMLRELHRIRESGVAIDREEMSMGITSLAVPILAGSQPFAAVSIANVPGREDVAAHGRLLQWAARRIALEVGAHVGATLASS